MDMQNMVLEKHKMVNCIQRYDTLLASSQIGMYTAKMSKATRMPMITMMKG
jgi:hypothetical protein